MTKYRIKLTKDGPPRHGLSDERIFGGDIIELEPIHDCPASECDGSECECEQTEQKMSYAKGLATGKFEIYEGFKFVEPKEQSLEEKIKHFCQYTHVNQLHKYDELVQIAKEHFQEHPEEITYPRTCLKCKKETFENNYGYCFSCSGLVSLDKVLEVFDCAFRRYLRNDDAENFGLYLRKSIENLRTPNA